MTGGIEPIVCVVCGVRWTATGEEVAEPGFVVATGAKIAAHYRDEHGLEDHAVMIERHVLERAARYREQGW